MILSILHCWCFQFFLLAHKNFFYELVYFFNYEQICFFYAHKFLLSNCHTVQNNLNFKNPMRPVQNINKYREMTSQSRDPSEFPCTFSIFWWISQNTKPYYLIQRNILHSTKFLFSKNILIFLFVWRFIISMRKSWVKFLNFPLTRHQKFKIFLWFSETDGGPRTAKFLIMACLFVNNVTILFFAVNIILYCAF